MNTEKFRRIRQLILDSTNNIQVRILFDSIDAPEKGYSEEEIATADYLFRQFQLLCLRFYRQDRFVNDDFDNKSHIYFGEFAKIIFIINVETGTNSYIFEEDLEKEVFSSNILRFATTIS